MDWQLASEAKRVFSVVIDAPAEDHPHLLDSHCGENLELRREVEALLESYRTSADFMSVPLAERLRARRENEGVLGLGRIGRYEILAELGRGGMASVFLAKRSDEVFERQVALKVINPGPGQRELHRRFQAEVQALSRLGHPNIVRLFDGGIAEEGFLFIEMEYVDGLPLLKHCNQAQLTIPDRLRLFTSICDAVAYAHRNLVVHRDLKPANILVTKEGIPKLLDFGIAKIIGEESGDRLTRAGLTRMTLEYASPEQIRTGGEGEGAELTGVSTTSDVYSLGVVLYELLVGHLPYPVRNPLPHELARSILEDDPIPPCSITKNFPKDLQAVLLRALRKEPERRYISADHFREDLEHFLHDLPVDAYSESAGYRSRKFIRRHRAMLSGGCVLLALLCWALGSALVSGRRAERSLSEVLQLSEFHLTLLEAAPTLRKVSVHALQSHRELLSTLARENRDNEAVMVQLAKILNVLGGMQAHPAVLNLGDTAGSIETYRQGVQIASTLYGKRPDRADYAVLYSSMSCALGTILIEMNRYPEALEQFEAAAAANRYVTGDDPWSEQRKLAYADAIANVSRVRLRERKEAECLRLRRESVEIRRKILQKQSDESTYLSEVAGALATYGWALRDFGHLAEALATYRESTELAERGLQIGDRYTLRLLSLSAKNREQMARIFVGLKRVAEARASAEESVAIYRRILIQEPKSASDQRGLCLALAVLAEIQASQREPRSVFLPPIQEALELSGRIVDADKVNEKAKEEHSEILGISDRLHASMPKR